ncbi:MAG TPA: DNA gyrase inhibitor YacG [Myxococcaceae bacterium]|nr:DNA gyrase inhibitor YacG [Myxococcaceae bacterium]
MASSSSKHSCPICRKPSAPRAANPSYPFCSPRCRTVDLGKWLGEEYRVPDRAGGEDREDELPDTGEHGDGTDA